LNKKYLTTKEASEILGLKKSRMCELIRKGKFPGAIKRVQVSQWQIPEEEVLGMISKDISNFK